jgi:hypothetical protein
MSKPSPAERINAHSVLTAAIAAAVVEALKVLTPSDVAAVLTRAAELLESEE